MKFQFFTIPVRGDPEAVHELNAFLSRHRIREVERRFVEAGINSLWSICVSYVDAEQRAGSAPTSNPSGKPAPKLGVFTNTVSNPGAGKARVIVRHLADAPAVDVLAGGGTLIDGLSNPNAAAAVVPAGTYPIKVVADADNSIVAFGPADAGLGRIKRS